MAEDVIARLFARSEPRVRDLARSLIDFASMLPNVQVDPKQTCLHLNHRVAFAGIHPRKSAVLLNLRTAAPIVDGRIRKVERLSANRYNNEMLIDSVEELDEKLRRWIAEAHALAS